MVNKKRIQFLASSAVVLTLLGITVARAQEGGESPSYGGADGTPPGGSGGSSAAAQLGPCTESVRSVLEARSAEKRGDTIAAANAYRTAISLLQSTAPSEVNFEKVVLADEPLSSIGRRMVYYQIKLLNEQLAKSRPDIEPSAIVRDLRGCYGKMQTIEPNNPTWKYLDGLAASADGDYKTGFRLCREAATAPGGEESVRQKARSLANHIKSGALEQEHMKEEDQRAYEEYVRSGAQAMDFAMVSAQNSAQAARQRGDTSSADMWQQRYEEVRKQREQIKIK